MIAAAREVLGGRAAGVLSLVRSMFAAMTWAEEEIATAMREHPTHADRLWHAQGLLCPTADELHKELLYRAHARELLARVAAGGDTRPGTAAECLAVLSRASLDAPLNSDGNGLFLRMWHAAGQPPLDAGFEDARAYHEGSHGSLIDEEEGRLRRKLTHAGRRLPARLEHGPACPYTLAGGDALAA